MTMTRAIERYFNVALYLLVLTGFGTLASTGGLDLPAIVLVGLALAFRGYQLLARREFLIPERWTNFLTLIYIFIYLADYFFLSRAFLAASVHLMLFVMVVRLFSLQRTRDHYMLAALSFGMVLAAAVLTVGSVFLLSFAGFLLVAVVTFVLMEMRHSIAAEPANATDPRAVAPASIPPYRRMAYGLLAVAPALMLMVLAGSFLIFFLLPRVSSRYLSAYTPSSDVSTGFTDRVQLGRIGQIQQSNAVVMHIEIQNDLQGAYDLKWRGIALSSFDGTVWANSYDQTPLHPGIDGGYRLAPLLPPRPQAEPFVTESPWNQSGPTFSSWPKARSACSGVSGKSVSMPAAPSTTRMPIIPSAAMKPYRNCLLSIAKSFGWRRTPYHRAWPNT